MRRSIAAAMLLLTVFWSGVARAEAGYKIYTAAGQRLTVAGLARQTAKYDIILFGEYHDNAVLHRLELELLQSLFARQPKLTLSLEMFERDVQGQLDAYLAGRAGETEFLAAARPWRNYRQDYRPLLEFAKEHALPVLASNIPRTLAAHVVRNGSLAGLAPEQAAHLPQTHSAPPGEYRDRFLAEMGRLEGMQVQPDQLDGYYQAQCLKDDTMAESIQRHFQLQRRRIFHVQGDFHGRRRLGVAEKLQQLDPALKILVITPVYVRDFASVKDKVRQCRNDGDILVAVREKQAE